MGKFPRHAMEYSRAIELLVKVPLPHQSPSLAMKHSHAMRLLVKVLLEVLVYSRLAMQRMHVLNLPRLTIPKSSIVPKVNYK